MVNCAAGLGNGLWLGELDRGEGEVGLVDGDLECLELGRGDGEPRRGVGAGDEADCR